MESAHSRYGNAQSGARLVVLVSFSSLSLSSWTCTCVCVALATSLSSSGVLVHDPALPVSMETPPQTNQPTNPPKAAPLESQIGGLEPKQCTTTSREGGGYLANILQCLSIWKLKGAIDDDLSTISLKNVKVSFLYLTMGDP